MGSLHDELLKSGCKADIKLAKSGYVVSYSLNKKTIANYVFCKKGLIAHIYADRINQFEGLMDTLPDKGAHNSESVYLHASGGFNCLYIRGVQWGMSFS